ncbi:hypothetical protein A3B05_02780 [Candidatus Giovannonibacteria bacterium RIFCSPLOWO2_01_FULL_43_160]|uniref:Tetratricopeptide TPR_2 repeat-containing protein n=2 Tax=Candidatus Giovannoniibacteriota TaxID=1752738 RepID=A0A0G1LTY8_9BACT|nr:MAG: Tetratricopeptide TPR_2 repeat-containing protein [Candidatus Giovannonibacteria bacterium GW2011_GWB1_43_13]KKS99276.1 MAG: Tetratricopeptide TPR_2 repeat-containing protein [Candidatus Giovannonibacteria bacterium GW2011_GWA1_43_15]KKT21074.1 MAG: Tetratricopeptide TPR_2 repeat-containing protein [Candidatus Giovannonibacteria bacterium GW2011_GWC2_43_8]KKT63159.1 MAG: Tetratricopeptide TPR_2 repeat-containing protein [Candidatus Giovannonibacteria bacterium GW2011_GWA2_44_26]OGF58099
MSRNNLIAVIIFVVLAAGSASFFIWRGIKTPVETPPDSSTLGVESPTPLSGVPDESGNELEMLARSALERKIPSGDAAMMKELKDLSVQLKSEPNYLQGWLQVGILRKYLGDYEGASLAWQYAALLRPNDFIAFSNLGDLYHYYLKDFSKAEKYLRSAVDIKPDYVAGYKNLFDLYTLSYPPDRRAGAEKAEAVLLEGIKKNPSDNYLQTILASYKNDNQR